MYIFIKPTLDWLSTILDLEAILRIFCIRKLSHFCKLTRAIIQFKK